MGVVGTQVIDALVEDDGRVGAAAARQVRDGGDERVHELACREAGLFRVEVHLVANGARLGPRVHPPLKANDALGVPRQRQ